ncbi:MAG: helix-turn-helix transcriptional regulator [Acidobacteria bacterium]|nr:helix-turn-helix transcriptional regulator [Acidobacteriota bacterium]
MDNTIEDRMNEFIRRKLRAIRKEKKLSIRQVAVLSDIPESSYSCLELGYHRLTLSNLYKIVTALGVSVTDVWPYEIEQVRPAASTLPLVDPNTVSYFRFRELFTLTDARAGALVRREKKDSQILYAFNLKEAEKKALQSWQLAPLSQGWRVYKKSAGDLEIYCCLKEAFMEDYLKKLLTIYMDLWLATFLAHPV